ncbi:MAG: type II toxin-antitoxin system HicB family antitoxin [Patescibacteria group bacterium]|jgi:hypothetical protein
MVNYPIIVSVLAEGRYSIAFPDLPGCRKFFTPPFEAQASKEVLNRVCKRVAAQYLLGTPEKPGWIPTRLKEGYFIAPPNTPDYAPFHLGKGESTLQVNPWIELELATALHWLPTMIDLIKQFERRLNPEEMTSFEEAAIFVDLSAEQLLRIVKGEIKPGQRLRARLKFALRSREYTPVSPQSPDHSPSGEYPCENDASQVDYLEEGVSLAVS